MKIRQKIFVVVLLSGVVLESLILSTRQMLAAQPPEEPKSSSFVSITDTHTNVARSLPIDLLPRLRFDWGHLEVTTPLAQCMAAWQSNCSLPMAKFMFRNKYGLGSDLHVWASAMCNAMDEHGVRIVTHKPWIWEDQHVCGSRGGDEDGDDPNSSSTTGPSCMTCYFTKAEMQCPQDNVLANHINTTSKLLYRGNGAVGLGCPSIQAHYSPAQIRASATEFLFAGISQVVILEARKQLYHIFGPQGSPDNLITIHIRWGDKGREMQLVPVEEYIKAVQKLLVQGGPEGGATTATTMANIFLATEDPRAVQEFRAAAPPAWNVYVDAYMEQFLPHRKGNAYNGNPTMSTSLKGSPGLVALASLLVAMEANDFVLTTASNWSRLMNELRQTVLKARLDREPRMIDLREYVDGKF
eukprot:scaffold9620_cov197-Amphora_coffeaeformis.AAC.8